MNCFRSAPRSRRRDVRSRPLVIKKTRGMVGKWMLESGRATGLGGLS